MRKRCNAGNGFRSDYPVGSSIDMVSTTLVHPSSSIAGRRSYVVLGVRVDAVTMSEVVAQLRNWIDSGARGVYVAVTGMHGLGEAKQDPQFRTILNSAGLVVPDGMPLV